MKPKALVYGEGELGNIDGKVTNGLVRSSEKYEIVGVIDSTKVGLDAGEFLDGVKNDIPVFLDLQAAFTTLLNPPEYFIYGIAPTKSFLSPQEREIFFEAMKRGLNIINGLTEFFTNDEEFIRLANEYNVSITDVRKPPLREELHHFTGKIRDIKTPVIAVLGTDCAIGKRTTAMLLVEALRKKGVKVAFIATGQTGLLQGAKYGIAIDMLSSGFATGEVEHAILEADRIEQPDMIIVEGQGAVGHPSFTSSCAIQKGALPHGIIVQHAPKRTSYCTYPDIPITSLQTEIDLIEEFAGPFVMAITINHENMTDAEIEATVIEYENAFEVPVTDVLKHGCDKIVNELAELFPRPLPVV